MSPRKRNLKTGKSGSAGAVLLCLFGTAGAVRAQDVLMTPPPAYSTTPPAVQEQLDQGAGALPRPDQNTSLLEPPDFLHWGPVTVRPHVSYQLLYGTGLLSAPGQSQNSVIQTFSPGVLLDIGKHWTVDYTPTLNYYSSSQFRNTVGQSASLNWGTVYNDWSFGFSQNYSSVDTPTIQTATQTSTQSYTTSINASHQLNSVMSLDMGLTQAITSSEQFTSSSSWSTMEWLNYQFWPRLDGSIGVGGGYDAVSQGSDMTHETYQARVTWRAGDKTSLVVHGGMEDRQYLGGGVPDTISPVYGVLLQYQPFEQTALTLSADRAVSTSLLVNEVTDTRSLTVGLNQRFFKQFNFHIAGAYGLTDYLTSSAEVVAGRSDTYYSLTTGVSWAFLKRATASLTYQYSVNKSNSEGFGYTSSQYGLQLLYAF